MPAWRTLGAIASRTVLGTVMGAMTAAVIGGVAAACGGTSDEGPKATEPLDAGVGTEAGVDHGLCMHGHPVDWPPGPYGVKILQTLPKDLVFEGLDGPVRLADRFEPCASQSRLLVIRTTASWCGTCLWHASHTKRLLDRFGERLLLVDLLVADEDNMPPDRAAITRWAAHVDRPGEVAIDANYTFSAALDARFPLPEYVFVDTRTMKVVNVTGDLAPEELQNKLLLELADLDGAPRPALAVTALWDGTLSEEAHDLLVDMKLPTGGPPVDATNAFGDAPAAATFGKALFSDAQLSPSGTVSCATCHDANKTFADGLAQSNGVARVDRNAPSIVVSAWSRWQFWDGRADTLWAQALGPPENPKEIGSSRLFIAHQVGDRHAAAYEAIFGALPANLASLPPSGKPGDTAYDAMSATDKEAVTRVYVNIGKALAAYERSLRLAPNPLDRYAGGDTTALTPPQKKALASYFTGGCAQCHWGPRLTDDAFHVLRFPSGRVDGAPDKGRADVLLGLASAEFAASSKWSDAPSAAKRLLYTNVPASMTGAFKTPSLRGVATTAPYGHGGSLVALLDVTKHYGTRGKDVGDDRATGVVEAWVPLFDENAQTELVRLFETMSADVVP